MNRLLQIIPALKNKGLYKTLQVAMNTFIDYAWDFNFGTDTMKVVELNELDIHSENLSCGEKYQPTNSRLFHKIMSTLNLPDNSVLVDFGSGKGRVLLMSTQYNFKKIVGVEFSSQLCQIARHNINIFKMKKNFNQEISIIHSDAVKYKINCDENVFFFFNPFGIEVMNKVLVNIERSHKERVREITIIYLNPIFYDYIRQFTFLELDSQHKFHGNDIYIFKSR